MEQHTEWATVESSSESSCLNRQIWLDLRITELVVRFNINRPYLVARALGITKTEAQSALLRYYERKKIDVAE